MFKLGIVLHLIWLGVSAASAAGPITTSNKNCPDCVIEQAKKLGPVETVFAPIQSAWAPGDESCQMQNIARVSGNVEVFCSRAKSCYERGGNKLPDDFEKKKQLALLYFEEQKKQMVASCCQGDENCTVKFLGAKLDIYTHTGPKDPTGNYTTIDEVLHFQDQAIKSCSAKGCITKTIKHELGHACQFAWNQFRRADGSDCKNLDFSKLYPKILGKDRYQCAKTALDQYAATVNNPKFCKSAAYQEVFADLYAANWWDDAEEVYHLCQGFSSEWHPPGHAYLKCTNWMKP